MLRSNYDECVRLSAAATRRASGARDLVHDILLDAIARGAPDPTHPERRGWLHGAVRKRAAFEARTAARRHTRETRWQATASPRGRAPWRFSPELLARLSPALRSVAALASAELAPREIRSVLRLSETAFRKRVSDLGRAVRHAAAEGIEILCRPRAAYALGPARAEILASLARHPTWAFASHDPDGHPLVFFRARPHGSPAVGNSPGSHLSRSIDEESVR